MKELLLLLVPGLLAYQHYQEKIPNGSRVPHPCKAGYMWQGVGHMNKNGGGMRNKFGDDFARNGHIWDKCLCETDSDGDGRSNGEELGDPDCEWVPGAQPKINALSKISHPGVCDPHDSEACKKMNNWEFCDETTFVCDPLREEGVKNFTLRFDKTAVPAAETTYMCQMFDIPSDGDWHLIGLEPQIDNLNIVHHAIFRMCTDEEAGVLAGKYDHPTPCGMSLQPCSGSLPGWTLGMDGYCIPETYGYRMGNTTGYTKAIMQVHWNNPEGVTNYEDESGMAFFYTEKLRKNDISGGALGPMDLHIPPKQLRYVESSLCSKECGSQMLNGTTRHITEVFPHMHYLGRGFVLEHWRGEERLDDLVNIDSYSYDNPQTYRFDPPVEYRPGDELITRCIFNSMSKEQRTYFGEGTEEEMCYAFLAFYPGPGLRCFGTANSTVCGAAYGGAEPGTTCDFRQYFAGTIREHYVSLSAVCDHQGLKCLPGCEVVLEEVHKHPCMQGDTRAVIRFQIGLNKEMGVPLLHLLSSCDKFEAHEVSVGPPATSGDLCPDDPTSHAPSAHGGIAALLPAFLLAAVATWI